MSKRCPDYCPKCGVDLKSDGYPLSHVTNYGHPCPYQWDVAGALQDELDAEAAEARRY